jgi:cellulose synthase/poly-beta-1,6-N-acetylglucosamine synthase-like glycosyltransferase
LDILTGFIVVCALGGTTVYVAFLLWLTAGLLVVRPERFGMRPSVTVVIPMHDEERVVARTLAALQRQDYPGDWCAICVDDRSTDRTGQIVADFASRDPRFRLTRVAPSEPTVPSPKKRALARGLDLASSEVLMTTDADCQPPPHWISTLAGCFHEDVDVVQGPKHILCGGNNICHRYQRLETLALVAAEAAGFRLGRPFLASAPSLAYRSEIYRGSGGFGGLETLVSGDDDMLVQRMVRSGGRPYYVLDPSVSVPTYPADTWAQALNQRARWASNGVRYESIPYVVLLASMFAWWCWLLLGWIPWAAGLVPGWSWWGVWALKIPFDLVFLGVAAWRFRQWKALADYAWCFPLQILVAVRSAIAGHFGWFRWARESDGS